MSKNADDQPQLDVVARAPFHVYYEGPALVVSALNKVGPFDILPGHADFFSVLDPSELTIETETDIVTFDVDNGMISVSDNKVLLFVNM